MLIGRLRHRVELQSSTETRSSVGEPVKTWTTYATVWAGIEPLRGQVALVAQQINAELTHHVTMRYNSALDEGDRIVYGARIFDVNVIRNVGGRKSAHELLCKETVG